MSATGTDVGDGTPQQTITLPRDADTLFVERESPLTVGTKIVSSVNPGHAYLVNPLKNDTCMVIQNYSAGDGVGMVVSATGGPTGYANGWLKGKTLMVRGPLNVAGATYRYWIPTKGPFGWV